MRNPNATCDTIDCGRPMGHPGDCEGVESTGGYRVRAGEIKGMTREGRASLAAWIARVDGPRASSARVPVTDCGDATRWVERKAVPRPVVRGARGHGKSSRADLSHDMMALRKPHKCETTGRLYTWPNGELFVWGDLADAGVERIAKGGKVTHAATHTATTRPCRECKGPTEIGTVVCAPCHALLMDAERMEAEEAARNRMPPVAGCIVCEIMGRDCGDKHTRYPVPRTWTRDAIIARALPHMARIAIRRAA